MGRGAAACAGLLVLGVFPVQARRAAPSLPSAPDTSIVRTSAPLPLTPGHHEARRLAITRAAAEHARGDFAAVTRTLAPVMAGDLAGFAQADRAAFLLGHAWLRLGQHERFLAVARRARTTTPSPFTRWLAFEARLEGGGSPDDTSAFARTGQAAADALAAIELLRAGDANAVLTLVPADATEPLLLHLRASALARLDRPDTGELSRLSEADTTTALGRDLAGSALLQLATRAARTGADPRALLARVSPRSRYAARALHMGALAALERGDASRGAAALDTLAITAPDYPGRREVQATIAGRAMDAGDWDRALEHYALANGDWIRTKETWRRLMSPDSTASLWAAWQHDRSLASSLVLDGLPAESLTEQLALDAADLEAEPRATEPALGLAGGAIASEVPPPAPAEWARLDASGRSLAEVRGAWALVRDSLVRERGFLIDAQRYHGYGLGESRGETRTLVQRSARLDSLRAAMDATAKRLLALRDAATLRFQRRAASVLARLEAHDRWIGIMRHFYVDGPDGARQSAAPTGRKGPDVVIAQEAELVQRLRWSAGRMQSETPRRIAQAYETIWGPRILDRAATLADGTRATLAASRVIGDAIDSTLASYETSTEVQRLARAEQGLAAKADALATADARARHEVAAAAVQRALAALDAEREGLDYGLAAASYARAVQLSAADTMLTAARVKRAGETTSDSLEAVADSTSAQRRSEAIARASIFLADHPDSPARGEMRFRLADLLVTDARAGFHTRMAAWLAAQSQGRTGALPVVDHAQALTLYRRILAEDGEFPHRDAVLFNAGMLLTDSGDPGAGAYFTQLLAEAPNSPYVQEASLRSGDLAFEAQRYDEGVAHYTRAAAGADPTLQAIALYKTGWAHYDAERFEPAAQAFRAVLDLYAREDRTKVQADLEHEAEQYFVYSIAASGGAPAFARAFPAGSEAPYERRVLRALGQHFRRYGEFGSAIAVDQFYLQRWPGDAMALEVAHRLADTQHKAERPSDERATRLAWADKFAPGGEWAAAQASDSLRSAGADFARSTWRDEAFEHHRAARAKGSPAEWRAALDHYERLLQRWPSDSAAANYALYAGEASAALGDYPRALAHVRDAVDRGRDSTATRASWQVVALTDQWYESTRPAAVKGQTQAPGRDSLAKAVVTAAEWLLEREPRHPQAADLVWREGQLALAHEWRELALLDLARFAREYPGDPRAPRALVQRAEVYFAQADYGPAGDAFEEVVVVARRAGDDSVRVRAERALPVCAFREAEAAVKADSSRFDQHAGLWAEVAKRWPAYEHAPVAQYRAGMAWLAAGRTKDGVEALQQLAERWPTHALARDARVHSAEAWAKANEPLRAADAWLAFANKFPKDDSADEAWLQAIDLADSAGAGARADSLRAQYLNRWPADREGAHELLEALARHELAALPSNVPVATLLAAPPALAGKPVPRVSWIARYLKLNARTPAQVSRPLLAEVRYRLGEEAYGRFADKALTQPLAASLAAKQKLLDSVLVRYRRVVDVGEPVFAHAATYRIGEALVAFGEALEQSERPKDLTGDDLKAYQNVLFERAVTFHDRGEGVWTDLLEQSRGSLADAWTNKARGALWSKLGDRFLFHPEAEFPVVEGSGPGRARRTTARDTTATSDAHPAPPRPVASEDHDR